MDTRALIPLLCLGTGCFEQNLGTSLDAGTDAIPIGSCDPAPDAGTQPHADASLAGGYSNGVIPAAGLDPDHVTTIEGNCTFDVDVGTIDCDGLAMRLNVPGVWNNIGYARSGPAATTCAGASGAPAPGIGVFSFGTLVMAPGAQLHFRGKRAVALVAVRSLQLTGAVSVYGENGGFPRDGSDAFASVGPSPGRSITNALDGAMGAAGGGGLGPGGAGGNCGQATAAAMPQFEPLCGGSTGGAVGHLFDSGGSVASSGGVGGGAILLAAGESISLSGAGCGVHANGAGGWATEFGGTGGGAGGTILIEAPQLDLAGCWITANGGGGGAGGADPGEDAPGAPGGDAGDPAAGGVSIDRGGAGAALGSNAGAGADGDFGGGGGGAAGFIRIRTADCASLPATISPQPTCELLVP